MRPLFQQPRRGRREHRFTPIQKMNGVCIFLHEKGYLDAAMQHRVIRRYAEHKKWKLSQARPIKQACGLIQQDFKSFLTWFRYHYQDN